MGFFAVLNDPQNPACDFRVAKCHLNFWSLSGILGRRNYLWDVGLQIKVGSQPFSAFQVAIPSGTIGSVYDLRDKMLDQRIGEMIFGKPVSVGVDQIEYDGTWLHLPRLASTESELDTHRSTPHFNLWSLRTATPVSPNTDIYLRVRLPVASVGRCWQWKRFWLSRYGALVDVRFADLREAWNVPNCDELKERIVPIEQLNFFVIAPATYNLLVTSPGVHYVRILEGRAWEKYLNRKTKLSGSEKLCIYQWRNESPITTRAPMRIFLQLHSQLGFVSTFNLLLIGIILIVLTAIGVVFAPFITEMPTTIQLIGTFLRAHVIGITLTSVLGTILALLNVSDEFVRRLRWFGPAFDAFEQWLLGFGRSS